MIYSILILVLLIIRNFLNKRDLLLLDSIIIQILVIVMFKVNIGLYGLILGVLYIGLRIRKMQFGNRQGDRRY